MRTIISIESILGGIFFIVLFICSFASPVSGLGVWLARGVTLIVAGFFLNNGVVRAGKKI